MINKLSSKIAKQLISKNSIDENEYEIYHYGLFIIISDIFLFAFSLIIGLIFNILLSSIIFFIAFFIIRRFAGGFHAKTELHCQMASLSLLLINIGLIKYAVNNIENEYLIIAQICCMIALPLISPADSPQKPLAKKERIIFKRIIAIIGIAFMILNFVLFRFNLDIISVPIVFAFVTELIMVILGKLFNHRLVDN